MQDYSVLIYQGAFEHATGFSPDLLLEPARKIRSEGRSLMLKNNSLVRGETNSYTQKNFPTTEDDVL